MDMSDISRMHHQRSQTSELLWIIVTSFGHSKKLLKKQFTLSNRLLGNHDPGRFKIWNGCLLLAISLRLLLHGPWHFWQWCNSAVSPALALCKSTLKVSLKVFITVLIDCVLGFWRTQWLHQNRKHTKICCFACPVLFFHSLSLSFHHTPVSPFVSELLCRDQKWEAQRLLCSNDLQPKGLCPNPPSRPCRQTFATKNGHFSSPWWGEPKRGWEFDHGWWV